MSNRAGDNPGKHEGQEESKKGNTVYLERCANEILRVVALPAEEVAPARKPSRQRRSAESN